MAVVKAESRRELPIGLHKYAVSIGTTYEVHVISKQEHEEAIARLKEALVQTTLRRAAEARQDLCPGAVNDIVTRGMSVFRADDEGRVQAFDGDQLMYGSDGTPLTPEEWLGKLRVTAGFFFRSDHH